MAKASKSRVKPLPSRASEHLDHVDSMVRAVETREAGVEIGLPLEEIYVSPSLRRRIMGLAAVGTIKRDRGRSRYSRNSLSLMINKFSDKALSMLTKAILWVFIYKINPLTTHHGNYFLY
jgi:hypothetical protein